MVPAFAGARASKKMNLERQSLDVAEVQPGPSWAPRNWPILDSDDLTAALDPQQMQVAVKAAAAKAGAPLSTAEVERAADDAIRAMMLIRTYRVRGHLAATLDPLGLSKRELPADLTPEYRSEEHTSELQSLMRLSYAAFCLKK